MSKKKKDKKEKDLLPQQAILTRRDLANATWNVIPLGVTRLKKNKDLQVCWILNDHVGEPGKNVYYTIPSTSLLVAGGTGSGKTIVTLGVASHVRRFKEKFQLIGIDTKCVEFFRIEQDFNCLGRDVRTAASILETVRDVMISRFHKMENTRENSIYKVMTKHDLEVNYYTINNVCYQFDEIILVEEEIDPTSRDGEQLLRKYPNKRLPICMTVEDLYNKLQNEDQGAIYFKDRQIKKKDIKQSKGVYKPKAILFMIESLDDLMHSDDFRSVDRIKTALGSLCRLGRAAWVYGLFSCQRASGSVISTDLRNNIQMSILLGNFDDGASNLMFEKDISDKCKPFIKGRGFVGSGNEIIETQIYCGEEKMFY